MFNLAFWHIEVIRRRNGIENKRAVFILSNLRNKEREKEKGSERKKKDFSSLTVYLYTYICVILGRERIRFSADDGVQPHSIHRYLAFSIPFWLVIIIHRYAGKRFRLYFLISLKTQPNKNIFTSDDRMNMDICFGIDNNRQE